jgi:hypothetical protein
MNIYAKAQIAKINKASDEAQRFIRAAGMARLRLTCNELVYSCKEMGACKRASMDLTRALAELRKP